MKYKVFGLNIVTYLVLAACGVTMVVPFLWMASSSLKREEDVQKSEIRFIPRTTKRYVQQNGERVEVRVISEKVKVRFADQTPDGLEPVAEVDAHLFHESGDRSYVMMEGRKYAAEKLDTWARVKTVETGETLDGVAPDSIEVQSWIDPQWHNYADAWNAFKIDTRLFEQLFGLRMPVDVPIRTGFVMFYLNSTIVAVCITLGQLVTCSMAAYAFSRLRFPWRDQLFFGYLATMMIPGAVTLVPVFMLIKLLNWVDTYQALIVPGVFSAYGTFLLRQFFMTLPSELEEAAKIDGAGFFRIYWQIALPLSKPALATLATFTFMGSWRSFLWPLLVTQEPRMYTLPIALQQYQTLYTTRWHLMMAASMIVLIPIIIVFLFNQRYFVEGVKLTGMKG
ncbi:MAG: carbohydrate ABC transporter permease [Thermoleophilia bacterium]|nr:carbohydrate ABC transporter permease [Thermoleophilia bacterium]